MSDGIRGLETALDARAARGERRCSLRILALAVGFWLTSSAPALAADEINLTSGLTAAGAPLALHGYDPVAFFSVAAPTPGRAEHAATHDGATYYFSSRKNLELFEAAPARYVPAFGGFCAYGVSVGKKFDGDPRYWTVTGGRLYLNLNREIEEKFREDVAGAIARAEEQWQAIEHARAREL